LDDLLRSAVSLRMIADVPLGAFLSGGIDSSLVVSLMQQQSSRPVKTFSIGFREAVYDEAPYARAVAKHLGTDHTETYLTAADALAVVPRLPHIFDEPFSDSSQIPALLVAHVARQDVTVALSGDGGDELFCGYSRYLRWRKVWPMVRSVPNFMIRPAIGTLRWLASVPSFDSLKVRKLAEIMSARSPRATYLRFLSHWTAPAEIVLGGQEPASILTEPGGSDDLDEFTQEMMALDIQTYLPDDILVKVDRSTMAESLEARAPLLDHRLVEFAARLPLSAKLRDGTTKWALRQILYRHVPRELVERPKMGFGVPIDSWLIGPLRDWAEDLLSEARLKREGFFDHRPIRKLWDEHIAGRQRAHYYLWDILMFQSWLDTQRSNSNTLNSARAIAG
jgi:asparagine synthase (glutamine-hydrolysing)